MTPEVYLEINGAAYDGFIKMAIKREFMQATGQFSFTAIGAVPFPIKVNDTCRITINNEPVINGFVEICTITYSSSGHQIIVEGRDKTCDLIDSIAGDQIAFNPGLTLIELFEKCLDILGIVDIQVISNVEITPFDPNIIVASAIGTTMFDFLETYCRLKQVIFTTDGEGNVLLDRASKTPISTYLLNEPESELNNILTATARYDYTKLFNSYTGVISSNPNGSQSAYTPPANTVLIPVPEVFNQDVRKSRKYVFIPESIASNEDVTKRVQWERDTAQAKALTYTCSVVGCTALEDDILWAPNLLVKVVDTFANINGEFLITGVTYNISREGSTTDITLVKQDAFRLQTEQDQRDAEESIMGLGFIYNAPTT